MHSGSSFGLRLSQLRALASRPSAEAALWTLLGFGSSKLFQLISNLILTRLLFPEAFGLMVIANVVYIGLAMFSDIGLKPAVVQHRNGLQPAFLNTVWTLQILRGLILFVATCALAWPVAQVYDQPLLTSIICIGAINALFAGFNSVSLAIAERQMDLKRVTLMALLVQLLSLGVTVLLAYSLKSVWALVFGNLASGFLTMVMTHVCLQKHPHRLQWDSDSWREIKQFGRWIFATTFVTFLGSQGIKALEAGLVSLEVVAFLQIATTLAYAISEALFALHQKVLFPKLSAAFRDDPAQFMPLFRRFRLKLMLPPILGYSLLAALAGPLIYTLYDDRYADAHYFLALYALAGVLSAQTSLYANALLARGLSRDTFIISAVNTFCQIGSLLVGFWAGGAIGMICGTVFANLCGFALAFARATHHGISLWRQDLCYVAAFGVLIALTVWFNFPQFLPTFIPAA
jgi:O-antigen/teichoic acid export membrane protein